MPTVNLSFDITARQAELLQRWFPRWNAGLTVPFATIEDAFIGILQENVKNFVTEENILHLPDIKDALKAAPDSVQDEVIALLEPYIT